MPGPAPVSCAVPFSDTARTREGHQNSAPRFDLRSGQSINSNKYMFGSYSISYRMTTSSTCGSYFVCDLLSNYSGEVHHPLPQLASRKLEPSVMCSLALRSNRLVTNRGRGTAVLLLGVTCYLATNSASAAVVFSLSLRARYRSVLHYHLQDRLSGGHFSLLSVFYNMHSVRRFFT